MLYQFLYGLKDVWFGFNVFRYVTVRTALAFFTTFFICVLVGPWVIRRLRNLCHPTLEELSYRNHKSRTPTMGGLLILGSLLVAVFCWVNLSNYYAVLLTGCTVWLAALGWWDDYLKLSRKNAKGVRPLVKIAGQAGVGLFIGTALLLHRGLSFHSDVFVPFLKEVAIPLGYSYPLLAALIIIATSNAVNLTDGMDGLAIGCVLMTVLAYGAIAYAVSNANLARYLQIPFVSGAEEATVFCGALAGSCLGFLWYNCHPAEIFMGDVGSLALGGVVGLLAIIVKQEVSLILVGGIFVIEAASVVIQVASFRLRKKRVFLMTPIHHHFELRGWPEGKIVVRFWIVGIIFALFTVLTLKIR